MTPCQMKHGKHCSTANSRKGLSYELMKAPAVSGSHTYRELCLAAKNEEKRRQYLRTSTIQPCTPSDGPLRKTQEHFQRNPRERRPPGSNDSPKRCYTCGKRGHLARDCWARRTESRGGNGVNFRMDGTQGGTKLVQMEGDSTGGDCGSATRELLSYLFPEDSNDDSGGEVRQVRINDSGSRQRYVSVLIGGVPVRGTIDSGSDITIIGRDLFRRMAAVACLRKSQLLKPDKIPKTYDGKTFRLDGRIDLDISFDGTTTKKYTENEERQARTAKREHQFQMTEEDKGDSVVLVRKQGKTPKQKPRLQPAGKEEEDLVVPVIRVPFC